MDVSVDKKEKEMMMRGKMVEVVMKVSRAPRTRGRGRWMRRRRRGMRCKMLAERKKRWVKVGAKARRVRRRERKPEVEKMEEAKQEAKEAKEAKEKAEAEVVVLAEEEIQVVEAAVDKEEA
jgi:hypothetical protein